MISVFSAIFSAIGVISILALRVELRKNVRTFEERAILEVGISMAVVNIAVYWYFSSNNVDVSNWRFLYAGPLLSIFLCSVLYLSFKKRHITDTKSFTETPIKSTGLTESEALKLSLSAGEFIQSIGNRLVAREITIGKLDETRAVMLQEIGSALRLRSCPDHVCPTLLEQGIVVSERCKVFLVTLGETILDDEGYSSLESIIERVEREVSELNNKHLVTA